MQSEKVSIIMPAYNAEKNIEESIKSVLNQSYNNWELIVVNDCSTDNTGKILEELYSKEDRIKIIHLERNAGVANARNIAMQNVTGRYIAFLDSDDMWKPSKLETQIKFLNETQEYFCVTGYEVIDETGKPKNKKYIPRELITWESQLKGSNIGLLTVVIDSNRTGLFTMPNKGHEDYITWSSLLKKWGPAVAIQEPLAYYREGNTSISSNKFKTSTWQYKIYRDEFGFNVFKSMYYFVHYVFNGLFKYDKIKEKDHGNKQV